MINLMFFVLGELIGTIIGFIICACLVVAGKEDDNAV